MLTSIKSVGSYVPSGILTNADLEKLVETSDTWIRERTGIVERRIAAVNETATDLAAEAAKDALAAAGLRPQDTDLIVSSTSTPDSMCPSMPSRVPQRLAPRARAARRSGWTGEKCSASPRRSWLRRPFRRWRKRTSGWRTSS